ncbi:unnamed protein product, partial [Mycena citricolor]
MWTTMMFQSLIIAEQPQYDFWTLVSGGIGCSPLSDPECVTTGNADGWTDGLIYYDPDYATNGNYELYLTKHFWTYKHFGNFVKRKRSRSRLTRSVSHIYSQLGHSGDRS